MLHLLGMRSAAVFVAIGCLVALACGGATTTNLFDTPPTTSQNGTDNTGDDDQSGDDDSGSSNDDSGSSKTDGGAAISETCGSTTCSGAALCCLAFTGQGEISHTCETESDCNGVHFACDSADDCPGGSQCCGSLSKGVIQTVACGTCPRTSNSVARLCDPKASDDECESGTKCRFSTNLGYARCTR